MLAWNPLQSRGHSAKGATLVRIPQRLGGTSNGLMAGHAHTTVCRQLPALMIYKALSEPTHAERDMNCPERLGLLASSLSLGLVDLPALAGDSSDISDANKNSLYVTLALIVLTVPGLWSLIKRAPKATIRRRTYSVEGPGKEGALSMDQRAKAIAQYFTKYNYRIKSTGEVITFVGNYQSSLSQAASITLYTFIGLASISLVLSTLLPDIGNWWYLLTIVSPLAGAYYWQAGNREEEVKVKMIASDDELETDIVVEGDEEELDRLSKELELPEKGKVYVKGLLDR